MPYPSNVSRYGCSGVWPEGAVFVIVPRQDTTAASAVCILAMRLQQRGCAGVVADGGFRDTPDISELAMPAYHTRPTAPKNLTKHHAVAINDPIACGGISVFPSDNEGVLCIALHIVDDVASEAIEVTMFEDFVMEMVHGGASTFGLYRRQTRQRRTSFYSGDSQTADNRGTTRPHAFGQGL